jgi:hypothetical protein
MSERRRLKARVPFNECCIRLKPVTCNICSAQSKLETNLGGGLTNGAAKHTALSHLHDRLHTTHISAPDIPITTASYPLQVPSGRCPLCSFAHKDGAPTLGGDPA